MMEKVQIWMRLGGYVTVNREELLNDYKTAIVNGLKRDGFDLDGESYAPTTDNGGMIFDADEGSENYNGLTEEDIGLFDNEEINVELDGLTLFPSEEDYNE